MNKTIKLLLGLMVFGLVALYPIRSISGHETKTDTVILSENNVVVLGDVMDAMTVAEVISKAKALDETLSQDKSDKVASALGLTKKPIYLFLNTPGGSIQAGLEMFEALKGLSRPVHTITLVAISMGFQTVENLGTRYILQNGTMMSHRAAGGFEGYFGGLRPSQLDSRYNFWLRRLDELDEQTVKRTNGKQTLESYRKSFDSEMWITGTQAVEMGYADKIVTVKCDKTLKGVEHHSANFMGMDIQFDLDKCPINTGPLNVKMGVPTTTGVKTSRDLLPDAFGPDCLRSMGTDQSRTCVLDTSLTPMKMEEMRAKFLENYSNKFSHAVDMF